QVATGDRIALSDRVCTALQILEHCQDVAEDYRAGRIYLPQQDMRRFGVTEHDLARPPASHRLRALLAFQTDRALAWLGAGAPLVDTLGGWARLAVSGYVAGGWATGRELRRAGYDPFGPTARPRSRQIASA